MVTLGCAAWNLVWMVLKAAVSEEAAKTLSVTGAADVVPPPVVLPQAPSAASATSRPASSAACARRGRREGLEECVVWARSVTRVTRVERMMGSSFYVDGLL